MDSTKFSSYTRTGVYEGLCKGADPREVTAEGSRFVSSWQPSACGDKTSELEAICHNLRERLEKVESEISKNRVWSDSVDTRLQFLESCHSSRQHAASDHYKRQEISSPDEEGHESCQEASPGEATQKTLQEKEENKKLKERIKELEARNKELLSKAMGMHKHSENMNDASRLSAVLQMYDILRLHEWEKFRSSSASCISYKTGSTIIKKLFDACEEDIEQRIRGIFEVLDIPLSNDTMTNSKQGVMQEIRNIFRYSYYHHQTEFYSKIIMDPPVKAVWKTQEISMQYLEHVDKKGLEHWRKIALLWPIMKSEERVVVKGVVWDEK